MQRALLICCLSAWLAAWPAAGAVPWLHVDGNRLVDGSGQPVVLRGVTIPDLEVASQKYPGRDLDTFIAEAVTVHHANVVRLPVFPWGVAGEANEGKGWFGNPQDWYLTQYLEPAVQACVDLGVYAIVDLHYVADYDAALRDAEVLPFWTQVAARYAAVPNVIFEIFTEPIKYSGTTENPYSWALWRSVMAQPVVDAVRQVAPANLVICGGPRYSQEMAGAATNPVTGGNVAYAAHVYPGHTAWIDQNYGPLLNDYVVFVTEWGYMAHPLTGAHLTGTTSGFGTSFLAWMKNNHLSWTVWIYDRQDGWEPPMFDLNWALLGGEEYMGQFVHEALLDNVPHVLALDLVATVAEDAGTVTATVTRNPVAASALTVTLNSSDLTELQVPASVVIAAGEATATFTITVMDNAVADGEQPVWVAATATGYTGATAACAVTDNDVTGPVTLQVTLSAATVPENAGSAAVTGTVRRDPVGTGALTVSLSSSDVTEARVPATVVILTSQATATFAVDVVDDTTVDGDQTVTFTAAALGCVTATASLVVTDNDEAETGTVVIYRGQWKCRRVGQETVTTGTVASYLVGVITADGVVPRYLVEYWGRARRDGRYRELAATRCTLPAPDDAEYQVLTQRDATDAEVSVGRRETTRLDDAVAEPVARTLTGARFSVDAARPVAAAGPVTWRLDAKATLKANRAGTPAAQVYAEFLAWLGGKGYLPE